jgi:hypothetical protein
MAATTTSIPSFSSRPVPWYIWCSAAAVTCAMVGVTWDISWHRSIGRDTFWTPAHICIHLCGVLAGISCAWLILSTTLQRLSPLREASVRIWGFRGPLGAFIAAWGGIAMLTSAPFDNWWHDAYGLDVKILSPPHMVLAAGVIAVELGALILILGHMNRAEARRRGKLEWLFLYVGGMLIVCFMTLEMELTSRSQMHHAHFYRVVSMAVPAILAGVSKASGKRWSATIVTGMYTAFTLGLDWILPLFHAEPKLGPVYFHVTQFVPPEFPLLLMAPAVALDLLWARTARWNKWLQAGVSGAVFLAVFLAVEWPFANFLMSPAARNWFFGTKYFQYNYWPNSYYVRYLFYPAEPQDVFWKEMGLALFAAVLTTRLGLAWGGWMQRIRR